MGLLKRLITYRQDSPLGWKVLIYIVVFSTFMTMAFTGAQLYSDYKREISQIESKLDEFERINKASITAAMWNFDQRQLNAQLLGLMQMRSIKQVQIRDHLGHVVSHIGTTLEEGEPGIIVRSFSLDYQDDAGAKYIGRVDILYTLDEVFAGVKDHVMLILLNQSITILFISAFILLIFNRLISVPLAQLARQARRMTIQDLEQAWVLDRRGSRRDDELQVLVNAMNQMRLSLRDEIAVLEKTKEALSESEEKNRSLIESTNAVPWIADAASWGLQYIGPQAHAQFGIELDDWYRPGSLLEHFHPEDIQHLQEILVDRAEEKFELECRLLHGTHTCWVLFQGAKKRRENAAELFQGYLQNIDARKNTEFELAEHRRNLEALVQERTSALQLQNGILGKLNEELQAAQVQLLQSEKLASIGQLAAG
ncbi:hypothetical protein [Chitinimonas arctica]|nr:hypothetical protein [Chitinimonas arctica]